MDYELEREDFFFDHECKLEVIKYYYKFSNSNQRDQKFEFKTFSPPLRRKSSHKTGPPSSESTTSYFCL